MGIKSVVKKTIRSLVESQGYSILNLGAHVGSTMEGALRAISERRHVVTTVIDVGASDGQWSSLLMAHYPDCNYLLVEAQAVHEEKLKQFCAVHENAGYVLAAAGEKEGEVNFDASDPFGGQASSTPFKSNNITVPMTTIDSLVASRKLHGPYLMKLDVHGYEVPIFQGAERVLTETDVLIVECYNFRIAPEGLLFHEMCSYLMEKGFRCIDMVDVMHRPYDKSLWQMDLVFVRNDRKEFLYGHYE